MTGLKERGARPVSRETGFPFPCGCYDSAVKPPRRLLAILGLLAVTLFLAGCVSIANPEGWAPPVVADDVAFVFLGKDRLAAIELSDPPRIRWTFPDGARPDQKDLRFEAVYTAPVLHDGTLYFGSYDGQVFALDAADGSLRWRADGFRGSIIGGPVLADTTTLVFGTTEGRLYAVSTADGAPVPGWPDGGVRFDAGIWAPPVVLEGTVYVATMRGELHAIRLTDAAPAWQEPFRAGGAIPDLALLPNGLLFAPSLDRHVYFVDPASGEEALPPFEATAWVWTAPATDGDTVYFGDFNGTVFAIDITTGQERWRAEVEGKVKAPPALVAGTLVVADRSPAVNFLDPATGELLNRVPLSSGTVRAAVVPVGEEALVLTTKGELYRALPARLQVRQLPIEEAGG